MYILLNSNKWNESSWEKPFLEPLIFYFYRIYEWSLTPNSSHLVMHLKGVRDIKIIYNRNIFHFHG